MSTCTVEATTVNTQLLRACQMWLSDAYADNEPGFRDEARHCGQVALANCDEAPMLSRAQKNKYLAVGGVCCPYCESTNTTEGAEWDAPGDPIGRSVTCDDCGRSWGNIYTLTEVVEVAT